MWREKRRRCLERRRRLTTPASELRHQQELEEEEAVAAGRRSPPRSSLHVEPLLPGDISALRQIYLRKRFDPPKYNFAEALRQRAASSDSTDAQVAAAAVPKFAANRRFGQAQSLMVDLDDFGRDVMMWEPPKEWGKWSSVPVFDPVVMPNRRPGSAYAAIVDSTVRQWRLESFKDHGRLHKIRQDSQDHEKHIKKELAQETLRREKITGNSRRHGNGSTSISSRRRLIARPASAGHSGRRRELSGGSRRRDNHGKHSKKNKGHTNQDVIQAIDARLGELDQAHYLMTGYEREQAGMRRKPHLRALKMKTKKEKYKKKKKKKKKKNMSNNNKKKKDEQKEEDEGEALDPRTRKRKHRRQSLAIELLRKRRTLAITADDLAKSNTLREVFLESARRSVNADRAAFWVFDEAPFELWAFSTKGDDARQVLRVSADAGIVGQCFIQGSAVIIHDAYKLKTFSAKMDRRTGYLTKSVLCIPCHGEDEAIDESGTRTNLGCVQLLNKKNEEGEFSLRDASLVQLQLMILRSYIRKFRTKEDLEANISRLASALRGVRQATKDEDDDSLKVRFVGLAKEYGNFNSAAAAEAGENCEELGGVENDDDNDHADDGKAPTRKERESPDDEMSSEEEYVMGVRNDFSGGVRSRNDAMLMPAARGQFMGSTSFLSSDIKSSDLERQAAPSNKFDRNPW